VLELLRQTIRPEFLNRIDESILFLPLTKKEVAQIVDMQLHELKLKLQLSDIHLVVTPDAFEHILTLGYDPFFGARPVKRVIQKQVLNELSKAILAQKVDKTQNVVMDMFDGKIVFRKPIHAHEEQMVTVPQ
jgi:ATP-dependent Clp protease ATP-binding subunit ClpB